MPTALIEMIAYDLCELSSYIGNYYGESFDAKNLWESRKNDIPKETVKELRNISMTHYFYKLEQLLSGL